VEDSSSTATLGCAVFFTFTHPRIIDDRKTRTAKSGCPTQTFSESTPEMGRAAGGGGPAARGAWANSRKPLLSRNYRNRSAGPVKLKKTRKANTEMQTMVIIASSVLNTSNHAIILPGGPARANGPRVTFASVLSYGTSGLHTPRSGIFSRASLKRFVKFAVQMARVSSTI
jgi:hypothetical protein